MLLWGQEGGGTCGHSPALWGPENPGKEKGEGRGKAGAVPLLGPWAETSRESSCERGKVEGSPRRRLGHEWQDVLRGCSLAVAWGWDKEDNVEGPPRGEEQELGLQHEARWGPTAAQSSPSPPPELTCSKGVLCTSGH